MKLQILFPLKAFLKILTGFILVIGLLCLLLVVSGNGHILNGIDKTYLLGQLRPDINDMQYHDVRLVEAGEGLAWPKTKKLVALSPEEEQFCTSIGTTAFLVIQDGKVMTEKFWEGTDGLTLSNSFSMAKSFTALAIAHAVENGRIESLDQPLCDFLPAYCDGLDREMTIRHLLQMSSGIDFGEHYTNPFGYQAKAYYGTRLADLTQQYHATIEPGTLWNYEGGNTVLLSLVLQNVTGQTLSDYFSQHIWQKIDTQGDAYWNLDREGGLEKSFSAFYACPYDYAKIGQLYLDSGDWRGTQLISKEFVALSTTPVMIPDSTGQPYPYYGLHWWLGEFDGQPFNSCRGMRGQYIICIPHLNAMMVRLGHDRLEIYERGASQDLWRFLEMTKAIIEEHEGSIAATAG